MKTETMKRKIRCAIFALIGLTSMSSLQAEIVNIDITSNANAGPTGVSLAGVIGNADGSNTWNPVGDTAQHSTLLSKDGDATGLTCQLTGILAATEPEVDNLGEFFINPLAEVNSNDVFFETYAWVTGVNDLQDTSSFTISGFAPGETADLYLYSTWPWADTGAEFRISSDGGTTWTAWQLVDGTPSEGDASFDLGSSYTLFEDVAPHTDGTILGEWRSILGDANRHRGMFNALQVEGVFVDPPEPPSITSISFDTGMFTLEVAGSSDLTS
ncbi:MAG: hypothetical protein AAF317_18755, partial [Pseudomonadota bacterium]